MKRTLPRIIALLTAVSMVLSLAACALTAPEEPSEEPPKDAFAGVTIPDSEQSWSNTDEKYTELLKSYGGTRCNGAYAVATDDDIVYLCCEDATEKDGVTPVSQNTVFDIASMSKVFTAVSVLQLAEQGKLSLDDTLYKYFPKYVKGKDITLYDLLHMTSGISDYMNNPDPFWKISGAEAANAKLSDIYLDKTTDEELLEAMYTAPLEFKPGSEFSYSNTNYRLLAMIIEQLTGKPYCDYVKENIFDKCGMTKTTSMATGDLTYVPRGYEELAEYGFCGEDGYPACPRNSRGDGGIHSCVTDMVAFDRALFGGKLLGEASMKTLLTAENDYCCGLKKTKDGYSHDGSSLTCMGNNLIVESEEFGHIYVILMERTGTEPLAEGELPDPFLGTNHTKGVWENGYYTNEYAEIRMRLSDEYEQVGSAIMEANVPAILADCDEEKDRNREAATRTDAYVYSFDTDIHDDIDFMFVNTKLAAPDAANYTEDDYIDDRLSFYKQTEADGWTVSESQTVMLGGKEYVRRIVKGFGSFFSMDETDFIYARRIDDDLMVVIEILAFYDDPAPEDYEQLFEQFDGDEAQSAANE